MKVKIGNYKNYFGPYQLAQILMFWVKKEKDKYGYEHTSDKVHKFGDWLAHGRVNSENVYDNIFNEDKRPKTWLYKFLLWIDGKKKRKISVRIDPWDVWSADHTLAHIILPLLKEIKRTKSGSPFVDDEDVPEHLRSTAAKTLTKEEKETGHVDGNHHLRWEYVLDHIIWSFEQILREDREEQFTTGEYDFVFVKRDDNYIELQRGPKHTAETDWEAQREYEKRIQTGLNLFGRYYLALWS
jgi:hypothetical protein